MSSHGLMKGLIEQKISVKKAPQVQGTVRIHFPNKEIQDFVLTNWQPVDIFARMGVTVEDVKMSNLGDLIAQGHLILV